MLLKAKPELAHRKKFLCDKQAVDWKRLFSLSRDLFAPSSSTKPTTATTATTASSTWCSKSLDHLPQGAFSVFAVKKDSLDTVSKDALGVRNNSNDNIISKFDAFQQSSFESISNKKFDYKKDLANILSLSSIMIVDKKHPLPFLDQQEFGSLLSSLTSIYNCIIMPKRAYSDISKIMIDFAAGVEDESKDEDESENEDEGDDEDCYDKWDLIGDLAV